MNMYHLGTIAAALWVVAGTAQGEEKAAAGPTKGTISRGAALASDGRYTYVARLQGEPNLRKVYQGALHSRPVRWHTGYGHFWPVVSLALLGEGEDRDCSAEVLYCYRLADVLAGKLNDEPDYVSQQTHGFFAPAEPLRGIHILDGHLEYKLQLHYDFLPVAEDKALLFVLTDARGHLESAGTGGDLGGSHVIVSPEEAKTPKWSLTIHSCRNTWDADKQIWGDPRWRREGTIDVGFTEGFHALGKGDDYYFLTVSGKLYRAPKPDKGDDRKMETVWDDAKRPVVAFITDADADRTFLFCKPGADGKGVYFEMDAKPDPQPYDGSKVPEAKADDPLPAVLAYAKTLLADKRIKDKQ
jgi:hypothetical protein